MPRATCRCGQQLSFPDDGPDRVVCPKCSARIRVRRDSPGATPLPEDGFLRFSCPCGRRLKVRVDGPIPPQAGKCPDCGRVVPVPASGSVSHAALSTSHPETRTAELEPEDVAMLEEWSRRRLAREGGAAAKANSPSDGRSEAGMRTCPRCGRPVHLGAVVCRDCGAHVPKK